MDGGESGIRAEPRVGSSGIAVLATATTDPRPAVRVAVAAAVGQRPIVLPDNAVVNLLLDQDVGVRKFATLAVKPQNGNEPRSVLNRLASDDTFSVVRENAAEALRRIR